MQNRPRALRIVIGILCLLTLHGCAPVVRWDPPVTTTVPNYSMDYAITYAHAARKAYHKSIDSQTYLTTGLSSGLILLGGVVTGLAVYGAHRDALIGAALGGGTAYALGNWNYSKQRQLIYQAGVEGINCSIRAVTPLYMSADDLKGLNEALGRIDTLVPTVLAGIATADGLQKPLGEGGSKRNAQALIENARRLVENASKTLVSGRQFAAKVRRAGAELVNAVDRIDAAVSKAALDTIPDLTSIPKVVSGLAGFSGMFAPGVESFITKKLKETADSSEGEKVAPGLPASPLAIALDQLSAQSDKLAAAVNQVTARLGGYDTALNTDALADCGVASIGVGMRALPDSVEFKPGADQTKRIVVSGGIKPYNAIVLDNLPEGLTVRNPVPFDSTFEVTATKSLKADDTFRILIADASNPFKSVEVQIKVKNGKTSAEKQAPEAPAAGNIETLAASIKKLKDFTAKDGGADITLKVESSTPNTPNEGEIEVQLSCDPTPPDGLDYDEISKILEEQPLGDGTQISEAVIGSGAGCVKPEAAAVP
jgi:hypothetical protein